MPSEFRICAARRLSLLVLVLGFARHAIADESATERSIAPLRHSVQNGWHVADSGNFQIHHRGDFGKADVQDLASHLEQQRATIGAAWLGANFATAWPVTCDVFLHRSAAQYEQHSRMPAVTRGYSRMKVGRGAVWSRRLDLFWQEDRDESLEVVNHELTHLVLAERFCWRQIPRWADEGIAISVESGARPDRLAEQLRNGLDSGRVFSIRELLTATTYPADRELADLFYAQSVSFVSYLATTHGHEVVLNFADQSSQYGVDRALHCLPQVKSTSELEQSWRIWAQQARAAAPTLAQNENQSPSE